MGSTWPMASGMNCRCPLLPWLQASLVFRRCMPVGEAGGRGKNTGVLLGGRVRWLTQILKSCCSPLRSCHQEGQRGCHLAQTTSWLSQQQQQTHTLEGTCGGRSWKTRTKAGPGAAKQCRCPGLTEMSWQTPVCTSCFYRCGMFTLLSSVTAAVSGLLVGYELGIISGALLQLRTLLVLTCQEQEMVVSSLLIGALLTSLTGGVLIDRYGRRAAIILSSCLLGLGSLVLILSLSYTVLIVGRIAIGVSIALSSIATCVYIAEIAPQHRRGLLVSLNELMIVIGILLAYISNYAFANVSHGWKYMFGLVIPLGVLQAIGMYFLPPSPRFLVMKGQEEAAGKVLQKLRALSDTMEELTLIKSSLKDEYQYSFWDLFRSKDNMRTRIMIGLTLVFFVQITGQPNILFYASTVLKSVGFQSNEAASLASTGVGVVKVISTIPATLLVDHVGAKTFLCVGSSVMAASLVTMGIVNLNIHMNFTHICRSHSLINQSLDELVFYGSRNLSASNETLREPFKGITSHSRSSLMPRRNDVDKRGEMTSASSLNAGLSQTEYQIVTDPAEVPPFLKWLSLASLLVYVAAFSIGLGPMPWLVLSEIFPGGIRGRAMALTSSMNWGINLLISLTFLTVTDLIGLPWVCFVYAIMSLTALGFIVVFIPETKGCSLEQISMELAKTNYVKNNICFMSHDQEELAPKKLQKRKHQEQLLECKSCVVGDNQGSLVQRPTGLKTL